jgi:hypothetical protein
MNDRKLNELLTAVKREPVTAAPEGFETLVMQQIRRNPARAELSVSDLLGMWFPRLAIAAAAIIALCVIGDIASSGPSLSDSAAQLSYVTEN